MEPAPFRNIVSGFAEEYDTTEEQLGRDFEALLADLLLIHAVEEVAAAHDPSR